MSLINISGIMITLAVGSAAYGSTIMRAVYLINHGQMLLQAIIIESTLKGSVELKVFFVLTASQTM